MGSVGVFVVAIFRWRIRIETAWWCTSKIRVSGCSCYFRCINFHHYLSFGGILTCIWSSTFSSRVPSPSSSSCLASSLIIPCISTITVIVWAPGITIILGIVLISSLSPFVIHVTTIRSPLSYIVFSVPVTVWLRTAPIIVLTIIPLKAASTSYNSASSTASSSASSSSCVIFSETSHLRFCYCLPYFLRFPQTMGSFYPLFSPPYVIRASPDEVSPVSEEISCVVSCNFFPCSVQRAHAMISANYCCARCTVTLLGISCGLVSSCNVYLPAVDGLLRQISNMV